MAFSNSSLLTKRSACSTKYRRMAKGFGGRGRSCVPRQSCSLAKSREKGGNTIRCSVIILCLPAAPDPCSKTTEKFHRNFTKTSDRGAPSSYPRLLCFLQLKFL